jgi:hypothetical protein
MANLFYFGPISLAIINIFKENISKKQAKRLEINP